MTNFLFTVYNIKSMFTNIEADSIEEAQEKIKVDPETNELKWIVIPETSYSFFSTGVLKEDIKEG